MRGQRFAAIGLVILPAMSWQAVAAIAPQSAEPIHLPLTIIRSNPVTTITVGNRTVQAIVDTGGGAVTLSKEVIDSAGGLRLADTLFWTDALGREFIAPRFQIPVLNIGGRTFRDMVVIQAAHQATDGSPVPNAIGRQFLGKYFVVVDYAGGSIALWAPDNKNADSTRCGHMRIPMEHTKETELAVSDFGTQSGRIRLLWDTGATYSMLPETIAKKLRLATIVRGQTRFFQSKMLSAAGQDFGPVEFVVLPLKLPGDFQGMLGANFFAHHVVCFDYQLREIRVR